MIAEISFSPYSGRYHIVRNIFQHSCSTGAERILLSTNATLVCGLSDIKSAVILSIFLSTCPVTDLGDSDTDRRDSLHDGRSIIRTQSLPV